MFSFFPTLHPISTLEEFYRTLKNKFLTRKEAEATVLRSVEPKTILPES